MSRHRIVRVAALVLVCFSTAGCSWLFVKGPPDSHASLPYFTCTESNTVPTLDVVWAGLNGAGAAIAATAEEGTYENPEQTVVIGTAWVLVSSLSARSGFQRTKACRAAKEQLAIRQSASRVDEPPPSRTISHVSAGMSAAHGHASVTHGHATVPSLVRLQPVHFLSSWHAHRTAPLLTPWLQQEHAGRRHAQPGRTMHR